MRVPNVLVPDASLLVLCDVPYEVRIRLYTTIQEGFSIPTDKFDSIRAKLSRDSQLSSFRGFQFTIQKDSIAFTFPIKPYKTTAGCTMTFNIIFSRINQNFFNQEKRTKILIKKYVKRILKTIGDTWSCSLVMRFRKLSDHYSAYQPTHSAQELFDRLQQSATNSADQLVLVNQLCNALANE